MSNFDKASFVSDEGRDSYSGTFSNVDDETTSTLSALSIRTIDSGTEGQKSRVSSKEEDPKKAYLDKSEPILVTKPVHVDSKCGSSGTKVQLKANMFQIEELADFEFNQYRVDFVPDLDMDNIRKAFIYKHIHPLGGK